MGGNLSDAQPTHFENHPTLKSKRNLRKQQQEAASAAAAAAGTFFFLLTFLCSFFFTGDAIEIQKYLAGTTAG